MCGKWRWIVTYATLIKELTYDRSLFFYIYNTTIYFAYQIHLCIDLYFALCFCLWVVFNPKNGTVLSKRKCKDNVMLLKGLAMYIDRIDFYEKLFFFGHWITFLIKTFVLFRWGITYLYLINNLLWSYDRLGTNFDLIFPCYLSNNNLIYVEIHCNY